MKKLLVLALFSATATAEIKPLEIKVRVTEDYKGERVCV